MDIQTLRQTHPDHWMRATAIRALTLDAVAAEVAAFAAQNVTPDGFITTESRQSMTVEYQYRCATMILLCQCVLRQAGGVALTMSRVSQSALGNVVANNRNGHNNIVISLNGQATITCATVSKNRACDSFLTIAIAALAWPSKLRRACDDQIKSHTCDDP